MTDFDDPSGAVHRRLLSACERIEVDVDAEWRHLQARLQREQGETAAWEPPVTRPPVRGLGRVGTSLVAVAALFVFVLLATRPVTVRIVVDGVASARDAVGLGPGEPAPPTTVEAGPPAPPSTVPPPPTTTAPPPPTTTAPPPTTTTVPATDTAHAPIVNGDEYRLTIRRVHDQINAAIGYGRNEFGALDGSDGLIEGLLGQRPELDPELRDTIGHLRQAQRAQDRNAASAAHRIIESIERRLAANA